MNTDQIEQKIKQLGPWHFKYEYKEGCYTTDHNKSNMSKVDPFIMKKFFKTIYPDGLEGKSFLDIGCNGGGYCFGAHQMGSTDVYGFDVNEHWIDQSKFMRDEVFNYNPEQVKFATHHMHEMPDDKKYDFVLFKGVLYHLPNPLTALEQVVSLAKEYLVIDTAGGADIPEDCMQIYFEKGGLMAGIDTISWLPGSGKLIGHYLDYLGVKSWKVLYDKVYGETRGRRGDMYTPQLKRIRMLVEI